MKAPPIRLWPVIALFSLAASACGIAIPEDTPERQATTTSPTTTIEAPNAEPDQTVEPDAGPDQTVDFDSLLTELDDLVADLDTTLEGVSQP